MCNTMVTNIERIGDTIVDAGLLAINILSGKNMSDCSREELKKLSDELVDLYLTPAWRKDMFCLFPNSLYINPSVSNKEQKAKKFLNELTNGVFETNNNDNCCFICGLPAYKLKDGKPFTKTNIQLVGSTHFTNFCSHFSESGVPVCARCVLAIQFAPLVAHKLEGTVCFVSCNNSDVTKALGMECIDTILNNKLLNATKNEKAFGIFDEGYKKWYNALLNLACKLMVGYSGILNGNEEIQITRISNHNQNAFGCQIYKLSNDVIRFMMVVMSNPEYRTAWNGILLRYPSAKNRKKPIIQKLIDNESILWVFKDKKTKTTLVPWKIIETYLEIIKKMNKETIELTKMLADKIVVSIKKSGKTKREYELRTADSLSDFKKCLIHISNDFDREEIIISSDLLYNEIFNRNWKDIRDTVILVLYEKLHDELSKNKE